MVAYKFVKNCSSLISKNRMHMFDLALVSSQYTKLVQLVQIYFEVCLASIKFRMDSTNCPVRAFCIIQKSYEDYKSIHSLRLVKFHFI